MINDPERGGGCACGAVRFTVLGEPLRMSACHCKECQRRTGSAFGVGCYFPRDQFKVARGIVQTFSRNSDAGRRIDNYFCPRCGTTVYWGMEVLSQVLGVAAGAFDNTDWVKPELHVWAKSAQCWVTFPPGVEVLQQSNIG